MIKDDEYFGPMEVYYGSVAALVPVAGAASGGAVDVDITYQGCADAGAVLPADHQDRVPASARRAGRYRRRRRSGCRCGGPLGPGRRGCTVGNARTSRRARSPAALRASPVSRVPGRCRASPGSRARGAAGAVPGASGLPILRDGGHGAGHARTPRTRGGGHHAHRDAGAGPGRRRAHVRQPLARGPVALRGRSAADVHPVRAADGADPHQHHRGPGARRSATEPRRPRRAFALSLVYVLAMALTYTVAGVLAGLFGANLAAAFQDPWIVSAFALVFVAARALDVRVLRAPDAGLVAGRARRPQPSPARRGPGPGSRRWGACRR